VLGNRKSRSTDAPQAASRWLSRHRGVFMGISTVGITAALISAPLASSSAASKPTSSAIPAAAAGQLGTIMEHVATVSGDAKPAWIEAVTTTRDKALRIATPGDLIPGSASQTVYLVIMKGDFTLNGASVPLNARAPTGHYLAMTFNPTTFQEMDLGISNQAPPASLGFLGPVSMLAP
jgi:hypothetical protein